MDKENLYKLVLLGKLHNHQTSYLKHNSAEIINPINKIIIELLSTGNIKIRYNYCEKFVETVTTTNTVYSFFEDLLLRCESIKVDLKNNSLIQIADWKTELKEHIVKIQQEQDYNQYLKHLKLESERFEIEYYDGIIVLRDKHKELLTKVMTLKNAVQHHV